MINSPAVEQDEFHFEKAVQQLQVIVKKLEAGELSLEDSLKQFEIGTQLIGRCQLYLKEAEQKVGILTQGNQVNWVDSAQLQSFRSS